MVCSSMDEALFFLFSVVRPWTNSGFCYFYVFVHGRTTVFVVFRLSSMDEPCFFLFLVVRPWTNNCFLPFLLEFHGAASFTARSADIMPVTHNCSHWEKPNIRAH